MKKITSIIFTFMMTLHVSPIIAQDLAGNWQFKGSPIGNTGNDGISTTTWEYINFTATLSSKQDTLLCHTDNFYTRGSRAYPMDWKMAIEQNGDKLRLGWVLDDKQPSSAVEFQEAASQYAIGGKDIVEGEHRYIYLLTYNLDSGKEEGITIWSEWTEGTQLNFVFPRNQQIDAMVSTTIPFGAYIGYVDSWSNPSVYKTNSDPAGIREVASQRFSKGVYYNLQGCRIDGKPGKGIYILNGKKVIIP